MTAREWLQGVTECARLILAEKRFEEMRRNSALGLSAPFNADAVRGGGRDPMRAIDELIDAQGTRRERLASAYEEIATARATLEGMRSVGWMEHESADILEAHHVNLMQKTDIARALAISYTTLRRRYDFGLDWLDAHGIARAREGHGLAT